MNVKKLTGIAIIALLMTVSVPSISAPVFPNEPANSEVAAQAMLKRLHEIKDMDKSNLSRAEKKELRNEVKNIRKELKANSHGIYLSVGAIIIIILLLILLL